MTVAKHRNALLILASIATLSAGCKELAHDDVLRCEVTSTTTLTDLDAVPTGMAESPNDVIESLVGSFSGAFLDEMERPLSETASLTVDSTDSDVVLTVYSPSQCLSAYSFDLEFTLEADDLPTYSAVLPIRYSGDGGWVSTTDDAGFDGDLPEPTTFAVEDFPVVEPYLVFSGGGGNWWTELSWRGYDPAEAESDGDQPMSVEAIFAASLAPVE